MYEELFAEAKAAGHVRVVCEVNIDPPSEGSLAFHRATGFLGLADVVVKDGSKRIRYLAENCDDVSKVPAGRSPRPGTRRPSWRAAGLTIQPFENRS